MYWDCITESGLTVKAIDEAKEDWDFVTNNAVYTPINYSLSMVQYQHAYVKHFKQTYQLSTVIYDNNKPVGVWPLCMTYFNNAWHCGSNEGAVLPPLFVNNYGEKGRKALIENCLKSLDFLCKETSQKQWIGVESIMQLGVSIWHRRLMERGAVIINVSHELYVDLSRDYSEIKGNIRKSYRSLISKGLKLWNAQILNRVSHEIFSEFQNLHQVVAGRITRSQETWNMQEEAINNGDAFLITLRDSKDVMVGGGLFYNSKDEGCYSAGAYNRELFEHPLGHVVQMEAISYMKEKGLKWHKIGARPYIGDSISPSEKEISIGHFKEGFASNTFIKINTKNTNL